MSLKVRFGLFILLLISFVNAHAQTLPCLGDDPDATCPLDTWVIVLVIAGAIFAAFHLYRRQRSTPSGTN